MTKCTDIYKQNAMLGEWLQDDLEHHIIIDATNDFEFRKRCVDCGAWIYPEEY
jgi:hypothetical protein